MVCSQHVVTIGNLAGRCNVLGVVPVTEKNTIMIILYPRWHVFRLGPKGHARPSELSALHVSWISQDSAGDADR